MCFVKRTRYSCTHISPIHPPNYQRLTPAQAEQQPNPAKAQRDADPSREWPTHPDTTLESCQDCGRRGARCSGKLEELEVVYKDKEGLCEECEGKKKGKDKDDM